MEVWILTVAGFPPNCVAFHRELLERAAMWRRYSRPQHTAGLF
jgi:hypothetical protein